MGSSRKLFRLVKVTSTKDPAVSEKFSEKDVTIIHCQSRRLNRWIEHFREQFYWSSVTLELPTISKQAEWETVVSPPTLSAYLFGTYLFQYLCV